MHAQMFDNCEEQQRDNGHIDNNNKKSDGSNIYSTHHYAETFRSWMFQQQWIQYMNFMSYNYAVSSMQMLFKESYPVLASITNSQQTTNTIVSHTPSPRRGRECEIPSLWRRFLAEMVDFTMLLFLKLGISLVLVDYIELIDVDAYDIDNLFNMNWDPKFAANFTSELITIELTNRFCVAIFEALCLRRGALGTLGGATPGKRMLGLRVVSCSEVTKLEGKRVIVHPAGNINFFNALLRSFVKNFSFLFFFPMHFTALIFPFRRAAYDIFSGCIVVYVSDQDAVHFRN